MGIDSHHIPAITSFTAPPRRPYGLGTPWQSSEYWRELIKNDHSPHQYKRLPVPESMKTGPTLYMDAVAQPFQNARAEPPAAGSPCFYLMYKQEIQQRELRNAARSMLTPRADDERSTRSGRESTRSRSAR